MARPRHAELPVCREGIDLKLVSSCANGEGHKEAAVNRPATVRHRGLGLTGFKACRV